MTKRGVTRMRGWMWGLAGALVLGGPGCSSDTAKTGAVCAEACAALPACGLATEDTAAACALTCEESPSGAGVDAACVDAEDTCECLRGEALSFVDGVALGAFPAVRGSDGALVRACGAEAPTGLLVDAVLIGETGDKRWRSIGPGSAVDFVALPATVGDRLGVALDCVEPAGSAGEACGGATLAATAEVARWVPGAAAPRRQLVLILDQSGSTSGLVDPASLRERRTGDFSPAANFGELASDSTGARHLAARRLLRSLPADVDVCVLGVGERYDAGFTVPSPLAQDLSGTGALTACFDGGDHARWLGAQGLDALVGTGEGRFPLWTAVDKAWDLLAAQGATRDTGHILVLNDGPDTCLGEERTACEAACIDGAVGVEAVLGRLEAEGAAAPRIDFVQFNAPGYVERDPRQLAVACASGGQHLYADQGAFELDAASRQSLQEKLEEAVRAVVASWDGTWRFEVTAPIVTAAGPAPDATPVGSLQVLRGALTVGPGEELVAGGTRFRFGPAEPLAPESATSSTWDRRLAFRKACSGWSDCSAAAGPSDSCAIGCSVETGLCADPTAGLPDGASCDGGICCAGTCAAEGACCP